MFANFTVVWRNRLNVRQYWALLSETGKVRQVYATGDYPRTKCCFKCFRLYHPFIKQLNDDFACEAVYCWWHTIFEPLTRRLGISLQHKPCIPSCHGMAFEFSPRFFGVLDLTAVLIWIVELCNYHCRIAWGVPKIGLAECQPFR